MSRLTKLSSIIVPTTIPNPNIYYDYFNREDRSMVNGELTDSGHPWTLPYESPRINDGAFGSWSYGGLIMAILGNTLTTYVIRYDAMSLGHNQGVVLRYKDKTHFYLISLSNTDVILRIFNGSAVSGTNITSASMPWMDAGQKITIKVSGNTIRVYQIIGGEETQMFSSSGMVDYTGYNKIGIYSRSTVAQQLDNFEVGLV